MHRFRRAVVALHAAGLVVAVAAVVVVQPWGSDGPVVDRVVPDRGGGTPADPTAELVLAFGMRRDDAGLAQLIDAVSDPAGDDYGRYLTPDEVGERFGADPAHVDDVLAVLSEKGIEGSLDVSRSLITAPMTVEQAGALFDVGFVVIETASGDEVIEAVDAPTVPSGMTGVEEVLGFESVVDEAEPQRPTPTSASGESGSFAEPCRDPADLGATDLLAVLDAYGIGALHRSGSTGAGGSAAIVSVSDFHSEAIEDFAACYGIDAVVPVLHEVESGHPLAATGETAMDIELLLAGAPDVDRIDVFQTSPFGYGAPALAFAEALDPANTGGRSPDVLSTSVDWCEAELPDHLVALMEHYLLVAAAVGTTVLAPAGDAGEAGCAPSSREAQAQYPASSPHVLTVGGTTLDLSSDDPVESVWNDGEQFAGGSGSSERFGRVYPDVALVADPATGFGVVW